MSYTLGSTLFKLDSRGKVREWKIEVIDNGTSATIVTTAGLQDGKQVVNTVEIYEGKNIDKSNETTYYTQAESEALATAELKLRGEYRTSLDNVEHQTLRSGIKAPMLAQKYSPDGSQSGSKTLEKMKLTDERIAVQPKLDGNRCLIKISSENAVMYTRKGDVMPVQIQNILEELQFCYDKLGMTEEIILDGELYSTEMSFNELNGHLKRKSSQDKEALDKIKYHLYDCMVDLGYDERYMNISNLLDKAGEFGREIKYVELIPSFTVYATDENITMYLERFLEEGHEGLMIRRLDIGYENKRSWQLCKVKVFEDDEYELVDIEEDARGGIVGGFELKLHEPRPDRYGVMQYTFGAGVSGMTHEKGAKMLKNKHQYIGKMATIEFFGVDPYTRKPRFGKLKAFRKD